MNRTPYRVTIEPLRDVKARQVVWTDADKRATAGLADGDMVRTYTQVTPFGSYLIAVEPADVEASL